MCLRKCWVGSWVISVSSLWALLLIWWPVLMVRGRGGGGRSRSVGRGMKGRRSCLMLILNLLCWPEWLSKAGRTVTPTQTTLTLNRSKTCSKCTHPKQTNTAPGWSKSCKVRYQPSKNNYKNRNNNPHNYNNSYKHQKNTTKAT